MRELIPRMLLPLGLSLMAGPATAASAEFDFSAMEAYSPGKSREQIRSVAQFSDLRPDDWAYQALTNLVTRYGCVAGYPNGSFLGGQPISRYEAAALLNACFDRVTELTDELKRLMTELERELALLRGRTDGLEARMAELTAMQFSTTTRLMGVTAMYLNTASGRDKAVSSALQASRPPQQAPAASGKPEPLDAAVAFQYSTILGLSTSFTGKDMLSLDFYTSNLQPYSSSIFGFTPDLTGTYNTRLSFDAPPYDQKLAVADLFYRFKIGNSITLKATAAGSEVSNEILGTRCCWHSAPGPGN